MGKTFSRNKTIAATAMGACLEWYDFSIYMFVTPIITSIYFPKDNRLIALMSAFAIFAAGYLMRPIAGLFFGNMGDKIGRKKVLSITTGMMCIPMLGTALLPTYKEWGIVSVIILLLLRLLQGFSVGGEYTGVLVMLLEQAPKKHRALITSSASVLSGIGVLLSLITITLLTHLLGNQQMQAWGWRIPFAIGFILAMIAYYLQKNVHESPYFKQIEKEKKIVKQPFLKVYKDNFRSITYVFILAGFLGIPCYLGLAYFPNYLISIRHFPKSTIMDYTSLSTLIYLLFIPLSAALSDRIGRKPILLLTTGLFVIVSYPAFLLIAHGTLQHTFFGILVILVIYGAEAAVFVTTISELFPTEERYSGVSTGYNFGNAFFGGTTPLAATFLIKTTQSQTAPAWYLIGAAIVTLLIISTMPETINRRRSQTHSQP